MSHVQHSERWKYQHRQMAAFFCSVFNTVGLMKPTEHTKLSTLCVSNVLCSWTVYAGFPHKWTPDGSNWQSYLLDSSVEQWCSPGLRALPPPVHTEQPWLRSQTCPRLVWRQHGGLFDSEIRLSMIMALHWTLWAVVGDGRMDAKKYEEGKHLVLVWCPKLGDICQSCAAFSLLNGSYFQ